MHPTSFQLDIIYIRRFFFYYNNLELSSLLILQSLFYLLLTLCVLKRNTEDNNKARHEIYRVKAHPPENLKTIGVSYEKFGGLHPKALAPIHCKPPYMSYNYRELRRFLLVLYFWNYYLVKQKFWKLFKL